MKSVTDRLKGIAWYKWLLAVMALFYIIYISVSYLYLPGKLKEITETDVSEMTGREISVEKISFNPFILSLTVTNFSVSDKPEKPLIAWDNLLINFSFWKSLFSWEAAFDQVQIDSPQINIIKNKNGFNFSDIIEKLSESDDKTPPQPAEEKNKTSIALEIFNTSINSGSFRYKDISGDVPAGTDLDNITVSVDKIYLATGDEQLNPFSLKAKGPGGSSIELTGDYRIDPLHVDGSVKADGIDLSGFSGFVENIIPVKLSRGTLSFSTNILAKNEGSMILRTEKGNISLSDLIVDDSTGTPDMLSAGSINIKDFSVDLTEQKVNVEGIFLDSIITNQWIDESGNPRYSALLNQDKSDETSKTAQDTEPGAPWDILIKQIALTNSTVNLKDLKENITTGHSLSGIDLLLKNVSLSPESKISLEFSAMADSSGSINASGILCPSPFSMDLEYSIENFMLPPFSEYLESVSWLTIDEGSLSVKGKASVKQGTDNTAVSASASLGINNFTLNDTRSKSKFMGFEAFKLNDIQADIDKQSVSVGSVVLSKPDLDIKVSEEKQVNLAAVMKETKKNTSSSEPEKSAKDSKGWDFEIKKVSMDDGTVLFTDKSIKSGYKTGLYNMSFSLDKIGTKINEKAPFSFKTEIDKYAPFTVAGTLDPVNQQPGFSFTSTLKGLDMSHLSPYSGVYIGSNLKSGKLSLNLDYAVHDSKLKGKNNINARDLYLGEKVPGEPVVKAPVGIGLALLRDISGVIDLDVGISGDLDDPGFSVSGVIIKALVNIIVKAAASPFKLLAGLVPGGGDDLGTVAFDGGASTLTLENKEGLKTLFEALAKRPQLLLTIKGNASGPEDEAALKLLHLKQLIAEKRGIALSDLENVPEAPGLWTSPENRQALEKICNDMGLPSVGERIEKIRAEAAPAEPQEAPVKTEIPTEEIYRQIYDEILTAQKTDEQELLNLADERALAIKQYLVDDLKLSHERISVIKTQSGDLSGTVIKLGLDVM